MSLFEEAYETLNERQRQAVDTLEGPVLVVAGPGTGKTQLLAVRAANILKKTDSSPDNILCLTFTNKAATNMRARLTQLIGPEARGITVQTFHAFAADLMNQYPDYFWSGARLMTAPDTVQLEVLQTILAELPLNHPLALKFAGQFSLIGDAAQAIRLAKEAGLTPDKLRAILKFNLAYIDLIEPQLVQLLEPRLTKKQVESIASALETLAEPGVDPSLLPLTSLRHTILESFRIAFEEAQATGRNTALSKWKSRWLQSVDSVKGMFDERRRNMWWLGVADVYEQYREALTDRGYYDYSDMVIEVIAKLEEEAPVRATVQEQYTHVMIDEFQDTNVAQARLAHLIADHYTANGRPNIMAVGDDDQSIFKFQGAELNNMLNFRESYKDVSVIVLEDNYRSNQQVLEAASKVIEEAHYRLVTLEPDISKNLIAMTDHGDSVIRHDRYETSEHQYAGVSRTIEDFYARDNSTTIAVLARSHSSLRELAVVLHKNGLPINYEQSSNAFEQPVVTEVLTIAEAAIAIHDGDINTANAMIAKTLRHPMWGIEPRTLWDLAILNRQDQNWLESLLDNDEPNLQHIGHWFLWLATIIEREPLRVVMEYLIGLRVGEHRQSPIITYFSNKDAESVDQQYIENLSALKLLQTMTREFGGNRATLRDFIELATTQLANNRVLSDETPFVSGPRAIELMTVHRAKGLEFDTIIIIDAIEKEWEPSPSGRKPPANLPLQPHGDDFDDYVRLMYVAVTRARRNVIVTSYSFDDRGREVLPTPLIQQAFSNLIVHAATKTEHQLMLEQALSWPRLDAKTERFLLAPRLENYRFSATHLLTFLDIVSGGPRHFFERYILGLPELKTARQSFGTAIHRALEAGQLATNADKFLLSTVQSAYENALESEQLALTARDRYLPHGLAILEHLFEDLGYRMPAGGMPERSLRDAKLGDVLLSGNLDLLCIHDNEAIVRDYKTGRPLSSLQTKNINESIKAWKHRTQLTFYAMLLKHTPRYTHLKLQEMSMVYVESETKKDLIKTFVPGKEDIESLERLSQIIWQRIMNLDFPDTSSYEQNMMGLEKFCDDLTNNRI